MKGRGEVRYKFYLRSAFGFLAKRGRQCYKTRLRKSTTAETKTLAAISLGQMSNLTTDIYKDNKFSRHLGPFELEMVKRDICFFYEEQKQWATISGQLSFGYTFNLPYWDYLDLRGFIDEADKGFIRKGSLLLLLSECLEFFEDMEHIIYLTNKTY